MLTGDSTLSGRQHTGRNRDFNFVDSSGCLGLRIHAGYLKNSITEVRMASELDARTRPSFPDSEQFCRGENLETKPNSRSTMRVRVEHY